MSYQTAKRAYEDEKVEVGTKVLRCNNCQTETAREILSSYGARCFKCFSDYCRAAPHYEIKKDYPNDPLAWAKRIMDKQRLGFSASTAAVKLAHDALGKKHEDAMVEARK